MYSLVLAGVPSIEGAVPDFHWPDLSGLQISNTRLTSVGELKHCPSLRRIYLAHNELEGTVPRFASLSCCLQFLDLSFNKLSGPLPDLLSFSDPSNPAPPSSLQLLDLSSNRFSGSMPNTYTLMPNLQALAVSNNGMLSGPIPALLSPPPPQNQASLKFLLLNGNNFTSNFSSTLPEYAEGGQPFPSWNLPSLLLLDASDNALTGALDLRSSQTNMSHLQSLQLFGNRLRCPVDLGASVVLQRLRINNNAFDNCNGNAAPGSSALDFLAPQVDLQLFDGSDARWGGTLPLVLPAKIRSFSCARCGLDTQIPSSWINSLNLQIIALSGNTIRGSGLSTVPITVINVDLSDCNVTVNILAQFGPAASIGESNSGANIQSLDLSGNKLVGSITPLIWQLSSVGFARGTFVTQFRAARNGLYGLLPEVSEGWSVQSYDLSSNNFSGPIPESMANFRALRELRLEKNPGLQAPLAGPLLPHFVVPVSGNGTDGGGVTTSASAGVGWSCPALTLRANPAAVVTLDPAYHRFELCSCTERYFGRANQCQLCPANDQCSCSGDKIAGCYPVELTPEDAADIGMPGSRYVMLPCPLTISGESLCNPHNLPWPWMQHLNGSAATNEAMSSSRTSGDKIGSSEDRLATSGWCIAGHQGRLCSECAPGYYASGRRCAQCLSPAVHWLILLACFSLLVLLVAFLYIRAPRAQDIEQHIQRLEQQQQQQQPLSPDASSNVNHQKDNAFLSALPVVSAPGSVTMSLSRPPHRRRHSPRVLLTAISLASASESNSWKLLVFHCQSMAILLYTQTSLPPVLVSFLSASASGSNGFALSSLLAVSCLGGEWGLTHQLWMALALPAIVLLVALALGLADKIYNSAATNGEYDDDEEDEDENEVAAQARGARRAFSAFVWRCYGVCWALLIVLVFPSAQLCFSALACTDRREGAHRPAYLNLMPYIACDSAWRERVLPPALIGAIWWAVIFPLGSVMLLLRLSRRLVGSSSSGGGDGKSNVRAREADTRVWPLLGQLVTPYRPQFWLWEVAVLARRLGLVIVLAVVPAYSVYLPLVLFSLIQLSALAQHLVAPYVSVWNQRAELASLYLLLVTYFTALVLSASGGGDGTAAAGNGNTKGLSINAWAVLLLLANIAFIFALALSFSLRLRHRAIRFAQRVLHACRAGAAAFGSSGSIPIAHDKFEPLRQAELEAEAEDVAAAAAVASAGAGAVSVTGSAAARAGFANEDRGDEAEAKELALQYASTAVGASHSVSPSSSHAPAHSHASQLGTPLLLKDNPLQPRSSGSSSHTIFEL
jgi:Leucine-rich repeat (LRR) protein